MKKWIKTQTPFAHYRGQGTHAWQKALWVKQAWRTMRLVWGASWQEEPEHPSFPAGAQQSEIIVCRKSPHEYISIRQDAVARRTWGSFKSQSPSCPHFFFFLKPLFDAVCVRRSSLNCVWLSCRRWKGRRHVSLLQAIARLRRINFLVCAGWVTVELCLHFWIRFLGRYSRPTFASVLRHGYIAALL